MVFADALLWTDAPEMGKCVPNMGTKRRSASSSIATALFSEVQGRVLGLLFGQPERRFHGAEIIRLVGSGAGATHRVLLQLAQADLLTVTPVGNQRHYQANAASPAFDDLRRLVLKTVALAEPLAAALAEAEARINRKIEPLFVTREAWTVKLASPGSFATRVMAGERITVIPRRDDGE